MTENGGYEMPNHTLFSFFHILQLLQTMCTCDSLVVCVCVCVCVCANCMM